jgi:dephospho-CoA kinase
MSPRGRPVVIGLTGGIAMGKSVAASAFRRLGVPVFDADAAVHRLLEPGGAAHERVARAFPEAVIDGRIDRKRLGARVFGDDQALARLEAILHPLVAEEQQAFLRRCRALGDPVAVLEVPLLFETGGDAGCDYVAVVSAPAAAQRRRALARPGMSAERLSAILARQMSDRERRRRADVVIPTGGGYAVTLQAIRRMLTMIADSELRKGSRRRHARGRARH